MNKCTDQIYFLLMFGKNLNTEKRIVQQTIFLHNTLKVNKLHKLGILILLCTDGVLQLLNIKRTSQWAM